MLNSEGGVRQFVARQGKRAAGMPLDPTNSRSSLLSFPDIVDGSARCCSCGVRLDRYEVCNESTGRSQSKSRDACVLSSYLYRSIQQVHPALAARGVTSSGAGQA